MNPFSKNINFFLAKYPFFKEKFQKLSIFYKNFSGFSKRLCKEFDLFAIHALIFCAVGPKTQFVGDFWENFRNFSKFFLRKLLKMLYFNIFLKDLANHALNFCAFGRKTICRNFLRIKFRNFSKIFLRKLLKMHLLA